MSPRGILLVSLVAAAVGAVIACSSSSPAVPCTQNPWQCGAGQTCWPDSPSTFACLNSGQGKAGDTCAPVIDSPTCGDGLMCVQLQGQSQGACTQYCDPTQAAHSCVEGAQCRTAAFQNGVQIHICVGGSVVADAGADAAIDSGASDSGTSDSGADASASDATGD